MEQEAVTKKRIPRNPDLGSSLWPKESHANPI